MELDSKNTNQVDARRWGGRTVVSSIRQIAAIPRTVIDLFTVNPLNSSFFPWGFRSAVGSFFTGNLSHISMVLQESTDNRC